MGIKSLIQVIAMISTIALLNGQLPKILKRVQIAKIPLIEVSKGSTWGRAMIP